jgi:hypothetical protein
MATPVKVPEMSSSERAKFRIRNWEKVFNRSALFSHERVEALTKLKELRKE